MKSSGAHALIIAGPWDLRNSLRALLPATPEVGLVHQANDSQAALRMVEERCPDLVVIDLNPSSQDLPWALARIRAICPRRRCLAPADHTDQQLN